MEPQHPAPRMKLQITKVCIKRTEPPEDILKAFASITLNGLFEVHGLKIIQGADSLFVAMPARRKRDGTFADIAHPTSDAARDEIEDAVLRAYHGFGPPEPLGIAAVLPRPPRSGQAHAVNQFPVPVPHAA